MVRLTAEIKDFVDAQIKAQIESNIGLNCPALLGSVAQKYGVRLSKSTIYKRARALNLRLRRGRKRLIPVGKRPPRSIYLDCAGAFFLKGAELEMGLLAAMNHLLATSTESTQARHALKLAREINALLLYAPVFGLRTARDIVAYKRRGLLYLAEQKGLPPQNKIEQYLRFLAEQKLLPLIIKEVAKSCSDALSARIDFVAGEMGRQSFYLDAQSRTVWPSPEIPEYFSVTLNKAKSCVKDTFLSPSAQRPLILQTSPGYTSLLPPEVFNFIRCLEQAPNEPVTQITIVGKDGEELASWENPKASRKRYFIFPLSPWQYGGLGGTQIIKNFRQYVIGPEGENMDVADAEVNLFNPQVHKNIRVRAALVRRKEERLALITNISRRQQRYIRKIAEYYFCRWPDVKVKTYFDLLEEAHKEALERSQAEQGRPQKPVEPLEGFEFLLEELNRYALKRFFPSENAKEGLKSMCENIYRQSGYLKTKQDFREITLRPFSQKELQKNVQIACQRFNQSDLKFPEQKRLRICLQ